MDIGHMAQQVCREISREVSHDLRNRWRSDENMRPSSSNERRPWKNGDNTALNSSYLLPQHLRTRRTLGEVRPRSLSESPVKHRGSVTKNVRQIAKPPAKLPKPSPQKSVTASRFFELKYETSPSRPTGVLTPKSQLKKQRKDDWSIDFLNGADLAFDRDQPTEQQSASSMASHSPEKPDLNKTPESEPFDYSNFYTPMARIPLDDSFKTTVATPSCFNRTADATLNMSLEEKEGDLTSIFDRLNKSTEKLLERFNQSTGEVKNLQPSQWSPAEAMWKSPEKGFSTIPFDSENRQSLPASIKFELESSFRSKFDKTVYSTSFHSEMDRSIVEKTQQQTSTSDMLLGVNKQLDASASLGAMEKNLESLAGGLSRIEKERNKRLQKQSDDREFRRRMTKILEEELKKTNDAFIRLLNREIIAQAVQESKLKKKGRSDAVWKMVMKNVVNLRKRVEVLAEDCLKLVQREKLRKISPSEYEAGLANIRRDLAVIRMEAFQLPEELSKHLPWKNTSFNKTHEDISPTAAMLKAIIGDVIKKPRIPDRSYQWDEMSNRSFYEDIKDDARSFIERVGNQSFVSPHRGPVKGRPNSLQDSLRQELDEKRKIAATINDDISQKTLVSLQKQIDAHEAYISGSKPLLEMLAKNSTPLKPIVLAEKSVQAQTPTISTKRSTHDENDGFSPFSPKRSTPAAVSNAQLSSTPTSSRHNGSFRPDPVPKLDFSFLNEEPAKPSMSQHQIFKDITVPWETASTDEEAQQVSARYSDPDSQPPSSELHSVSTTELATAKDSGHQCSLDFHEPVELKPAEDVEHGLPATFGHSGAASQSNSEAHTDGIDDLTENMQKFSLSDRSFAEVVPSLSSVHSGNLEGHTEEEGVASARSEALTPKVTSQSSDASVVLEAEPFESASIEVEIVEEIETESPVKHTLVEEPSFTAALEPSPSTEKPEDGLEKASIQTSGPPTPEQTTVINKIDLDELPEDRQSAEKENEPEDSFLIFPPAPRPVPGDLQKQKEAAEERRFNVSRRDMIEDFISSFSEKQSPRREHSPRSYDASLISPRMRLATYTPPSMSPRSRFADQISTSLIEGELKAALSESGNKSILEESLDDLLGIKCFMKSRDQLRHVPMETVQDGDEEPPLTDLRLAHGSLFDTPRKSAFPSPPSTASSREPKFAPIPPIRTAEGAIELIEYISQQIAKNVPLSAVREEVLKRIRLDDLKRTNETDWVRSNVDADILEQTLQMSQLFMEAASAEAERLRELSQDWSSDSLAQRIQNTLIAFAPLDPGVEFVTRRFDNGSVASKMACAPDMKEEEKKAHIILRQVLVEDEQRLESFCASFKKDRAVVVSKKLLDEATNDAIESLIL